VVLHVVHGGKTVVLNCFYIWYTIID
jgi:hypothetical protein